MRDWSPVPKPPVQGVGGWLLWLCVGLAVLSPLIAIGSLANYKEVQPILNVHPGFRTAWTIETLITCGLIVYSIYSGVQLWGVKVGAVANARRFFILSPVILLVSALPYFMIGLPSDATSAIGGETFKQGVRAGIGSLIWYLYLQKSKRVRNTFPSEFPLAPGVAEGLKPSAN